MDKVKEFGHMDLVPLAFNFAEDDTCLNNDPKTLLVGPSAVADNEVNRYLATLVRWNGKECTYPLGTLRGARSPSRTYTPRRI